MWNKPAYRSGVDAGVISFRSHHDASFVSYVVGGPSRSWWMIPGTAEWPSEPDHGPLVEELRSSYPYGSEAFGMRSFIRLIVFVVSEMKARGLT